jgi:site-specific DNA-methyltransferase (adenine-specific)
MMTEQASFTLRNRNPDVLTCIANLSNDEVFTPPDLANQMLDMLTEAWAKDNNGENIWENKDVKFLDPCTKSGVFLREITTRLTQGLEKKIPNLENRVDHILSKQVYGIAISKLTSLLARRSVYCSKSADGEHSIAKSLKSKDGNIWFERIEHKWADERCVFCGAGRSTFNRNDGLETHAYALIHTDNPKTKLAEIFGETMQFDVIIGNPPYQIDAEGNTRTMPIYQKFVDSAMTLDPRYILMITPSRWFAGGLGLDEFRKKMLADRRIKALVDYPNAGEVFPGVSIEGGVSYFLWDRNHNGDAKTKTVRGGISSDELHRSLDEFDVLVRDGEALPILRKVRKFDELSFSKLVSPQKPFGLLSNFAGYTTQKSAKDDFLFYGVSKGKRVEAWVQQSLISMNIQLAKTAKVLLPEARGKAPDGVADLVLGRPWVVSGNSVCTQTFMFVPVANLNEGKIVERYISTKLFRFLVSLRKISQHTKADTYAWVPQQTWDKVWTDEELYKKYKLSNLEIDFIEKMIRPMNLDGEISNE